ncbi:MAG: hypothetical protein AB1405_16250, partial [Bdellovibrionota bacterium]
LLKRTLVTVGQIFDSYNNGKRAGIPECGTPGSVDGNCRTAALPIAEIALDGIADQLTSAAAPLVRCTAPGMACNSAYPGCGSVTAHPGCAVAEQLVFRNAEKLPIGVMMDTFDELFIDNPPAGCEFYATFPSCDPDGGGSLTEACTTCNQVRNLDFDKLNSIWDFLDNFVNESLSQAERDQIVEVLPTMMGGHQKSSTGVRVFPNFKRIIPGPRPVVTQSVWPNNLGEPEGNPPLAGSAADAQIWPPDRAFPSPLVACTTSGAASFCAAGNCNTCWTPAEIFANVINPQGGDGDATNINGRTHGRNPYDRFLCDDFNCANSCGGQTAGGVGVYWSGSQTSKAADANQTACQTANKLTQKLVNTYYGCWSVNASGQPDNNWRWNLDVLSTPAGALPETPGDCFDAPDMTRGLDEAVRQYMGIDTHGNFLGFISIDTNELLSAVAGFPDPSLMPSVNLTYKIFGLGATVPKSEVLNLFSALRSARAILANPLVGGALEFRNNCAGFFAAESGSRTLSVGDRRLLTNGIDRSAALEPLVRDPAFEALQKMLIVLAELPNPPQANPADGLYQTGSACKYNGATAIDVYPSNHSKNPLPGREQMVWGQGPVVLQFLTIFENTGYAQLSLYELLVGIEEGPNREVFDALWEVLGDWREVTADVDSRIPPGSNFMRVVLDGVDNMISPRDGTTVPCGNDGTSCGGADGKGYAKTGAAEPFLYPLFPIMQKIGGVKMAAEGLTLTQCVNQWGGCVGNGYGLLIDTANDPNIDFLASGVVGCDPTAAPYTCPGDAKPDYLYISCMGGQGSPCNRSNPGGTLLTGTGIPAPGYSYLGHTFKVVKVIDDDNVVVERTATDTPTIGIFPSPSVNRTVNIKVQTFTRASMSQGLRAIARAIIDDFNQDPDVPGVDVLDVDEVVADLFRCDTEGFFIDTIMAYLDDKATNGDIRSLRNTIFALNEAPDTRDATLDTIGATLGATGGAVIDFDDVCVCKSRGLEIVTGTCDTPPNPGSCKGDAPLTNVIPILRDGGLEDPPEQFALQESVDNLANPFNQDAVRRLSTNKANCATDGFVLPSPATCAASPGPGIPGGTTANCKAIPRPECVAFIDPILDAFSSVTKKDSFARSGSGDARLAEVNATVPADVAGDNLTAFRGRLVNIMSGSGVSGLDTFSSITPLSNGDCTVMSGSEKRPFLPDGVLDDCGGIGGRPDFLSRVDDGTPDAFLNRGANPQFIVGNWFHNDSTDKTISIVSATIYHDGAVKDSPTPNDRVGRIRVLRSNREPSTAAGDMFAAPTSCFFNTGVTGGGCTCTSTNTCTDANGELRINSFYFRAREGLQPVSVYPPVDVPPGQWVYI